MANTGTQATDRLKEVSQELLGTLGQRAADKISHSMGGLTERLDDVAGGGPVKGVLGGAAKAATEGKNPTGGALKGALSGVKDKLTGGGGGGKGGGGKPTKATVIFEEIDVGVPVKVAYDQWTQFGDFSDFMKKVENVDAEEDNKLSWKAKIVWSHRTWEATILDQVPDERIVWRSKGQKGHVDGAVTFHEIGPNLTRIVVALEYYPQGLFERTGNIWRAQGRRVHAELRHFQRHVMTRTILNPDELEGWRGEIHDAEVVKSHEDAVEEEQSQEQSDQDQSDQDNSDQDNSDQDNSEDSGNEDEYDEEPEDSDEPDDDAAEPEDEYEDEDSDEEQEDEPEDSEDEPEDSEDEYDDEDSDEDSGEEQEDEPEDEYEDEPDESQDEDAEDEPADDEEPADQR